MASLPVPFREVLVLREIHDLDYRTIAEVAALPIGTVMSRLARARRMLTAAIAAGHAMTLSAHEELLLNAYLDGELDPIEATRFEQRLVSDAALNARIETLRALRAALRLDLAEDVPSPELRRRIMSKLNLVPRADRNSWLALAASFLIGAVLAGVTTFGALNYRASDDVAAEIVSAHIRALMAPQPIDVASSDHHTVKPWFNGKLAFAPTVVDLSAKGFPLVGGRIDVVKGRTGGLTRLQPWQASHQPDGDAQHAWRT